MSGKQELSEQQPRQEGRRRVHARLLIKSEVSQGGKN
jgi:hypothetical protein